MHDAKSNLSRLINEEFIIARNGLPVARVTPILSSTTKLFGSMPGIAVPDDFDTMLSTEIVELFGGPDAASQAAGGRRMGIYWTPGCPRFSSPDSRYEIRQL